MITGSFDLNTNVLIDGITETIKHETKSKIGDFLLLC